ncbi:hypothetical protein SAMN04487995_3089 [Dyadobacter koreensis]|uniref:DUF3108 domain-containing protein n=1 Tax=Dyadobacter koreensis TaxID=408657 RepID=A0A1H6VQM6_9BACT|nr:DUF6134 family protein [Dyadobacter koreensis]SEJ02532.1 hypothetical protein SAMN04487995_3089 [Dyadobacter koreensis]
MKLFYSLAMLFVLTGPFKTYSQIVVYDIIIARQTVGSVKVHQIDSTGEHSKLRIDAAVSIPFYSGSLQSENQFSNGLLKSSTTDYMVNGKKKERTFTTKVGSGSYNVDYYGSGKTYDERKNIAQDISKTIVGLYYLEPVNLKAVYSEKYGQMCQIVNLGENRYAVTMPGGKKNIYIYDGGKCKEVAVELGGFKLRIVRREMATAMAKK